MHYLNKIKLAVVVFVSFPYVAVAEKPDRKQVLIEELSVSNYPLRQNQYTSNTSNSNKETSRLHLDFLSSYHPNHFSYVVPVESNDRGDVEHTQFYLSFKAPALDFNGNGGIRKKHLIFLPKKYRPDRLFLTYSGLYDFYINALTSNNALTPSGTSIYDSSPVISKIQNPGLFFEWDLPKYKNHSGNNTLQLGFFHESNGQTLSSVADFNRLRAETSEEFALSQVSRSWNYISLAYEYQNYSIYDDIPDSKKWFHLRAELRGYLGDREEAIFWQPLSDQPKISDFDGLRITAETKLNLPLFTDKAQLIRAEFKTGVSDFESLKNISMKLSYNIRLSSSKGAWLSFSYFNGYGKDLSNYHQRRKFFSVGFEFR